ncbi:MAG TPA: phosphoribosyltransferase family protein [Gemmatimonadales bacterium]|nr:phosphoribosyltransferase family protein [Gemmatimonadales bacterium]
MALPPRPPRPTPRPPTGTRPKGQSPRGVLQVDWALFGELCRVLALKVFREYDPEVVIGIAKAGVIPGAVVASILQRDFASIAITREGSVIAGPPRLVTGKRVLLVDETCESGNTMKLALAAVRDLKPAEVKTAVSFKTGTYKPDYYALENENFIILPWDLEVIVDGEIVVRPDYRDKLKDTR